MHTGPLIPTHASPPIPTLARQQGTSVLRHQCGKYAMPETHHGPKWLLPPPPAACFLCASSSTACLTGSEQLQVCQCFESARRTKRKRPMTQQRHVPLIQKRVADTYHCSDLLQHAALSHRKGQTGSDTFMPLHIISSIQLVHFLLPVQGTHMPRPTYRNQYNSLLR